MLIYSICYYYGRNKKQNINTHVNCFLEINKPKDLFLVCIMIDSHNIEFHNKIRFEIMEYINSNYNINFDIITDFNWGGTIAALYDTYLYSKKIYSELNPYIALFEEDFYHINKLFLDDSINLLNCNKYIYIGEHKESLCDPNNNIRNTKVYKNDVRQQNGLVFKDIYTKYNCNIVDSKYTDGGFYFSTLENFKKIEEKIGIFHKGDSKKKYDRVLDGIILGEVGFPSQIAKYFDFIGLTRNIYFKHLE